jgi:acetyl esterase/lipase
VIVALALFAGSAQTAAQPRPAAPGWTVIRDIPYPGAAKGDRRRSLDLYQPSERGQKPPLVIFIHGGFWLLDDDHYRIGPAFAESLAKEGVAVALLRYRLAPGARHPAQAEDVAAGVALLVRQAERYGYDGKRIYLAGHSAGGHLAALVALDPRYLARHQVTPAALAGVIPFSGIYDLSLRPGISDNQREATEKTFGKDPGVLEQASPLRHVRATAPPFLILGAQNDFPEFLPDMKRFSDALMRAGQPSAERWIVPNVDHFSLVQLDDRDNSVRFLVLDFIKVTPLPPSVKMWADARRRWRDPPFTTLPFWRHANLIRPYPVDQRFVASLIAVFGDSRHELLEWPLERFHAIGLFDYLAALPAAKLGRGDYLVVTNVQNEKRFWRRETIAPYDPVLVVGLDDEKNLFRLSIFYRGQREYSWKDGPMPPMMARPLGAFVHFMKEPPPDVELEARHFGLTDDSFRLVANDPLAALRDLPKDVFDTVTERNACVYCHSWRGAGTTSHHVTAETGSAHGGMALPLESYPPEVWKAFLFDHEAVVRKIGVRPNPVADPARQALYELVNESRRVQERKR